MYRNVHHHVVGAHMKVPHRTKQNRHSELGNKAALILLFFSCSIARSAHEISVNPDIVLEVETYMTDFRYDH